MLKINAITLAVLSSDAVIKLVWSFEKLTPLTGAVCPLSVFDSPFALGIHNLTVLSLDADASKSPWGENCTLVTTPYK